MRRSLHIGLNAVNPDHYNGWPGELNACVDDARCLAALCAQHGFRAEALFNEKAARENFGEAIADLATNSMPGDVVVISFSGHGGRAPGWSWSGYTESLCFWNGVLTDAQLRSHLEAFRGGVSVVVILDACHSGGMDRALPAARVRAMPRFIAERIAPPQIQLPVRALTASVLLLTACRADEVALDGFTNGAFTGSLLRAREEFPNAIVPTWEEWFNATALLMLREHAPQHPQAIRLGRDQTWNQRINA